MNYCLIVGDTPSDLFGSHGQKIPTYTIEEFLALQLGLESKERFE